MRGAIRTDYEGSGADVLDFQAETDDNLTWVLTALPVDTATMTPGTTYRYDIEYEIPSQNFLRTFLGGEVEVLGQVTSGA